MKKKYLILGLIILIYLIFVFCSAGQLYYGDEVSFVIAAKEIASGQIAGHLGFGAGEMLENKFMLSQTPTYVYLLSLSVFLFGENPYSIRLVSTLFAIGIIILIYLITKKILQDRDIENAETWALIAAFIYAISPLAIQSSILVDIDGGLLNFSILLFLYFYISKKNFAYLIPSLFMVFASKMIGPVMLFASLFLLNLIVKDFKEIKRIMKLFLISGGSFFLSFFIYAKIFNLDWTRLFEHNSILNHFKGLISSPYPVIARALWGFKVFFYFATPFLFFLFIIISYKILKNIFIFYTDYINKNRDIFLLWVYITIILLFFLTIGNAGWNFPKYYTIILPSIIILTIFFTPKKIINIKKAIPLIIITIFLLLGYFIIFLGDPIIPESSGRFATTTFSEVAKLVLIRVFMYAVVPIFLCIGLFERIPKKKIWLVLFFLVIFTSLYINIIQAKADYSTHFIYGDKGLEEVLDFMKEVPPSEILCYYHVGYYLGYLEISELASLYHYKRKLMEVIQTKNINWIILYQKDIDLIGEESLKDFKLEKQIGSYIILKRGE